MQNATTNMVALLKVKLSVMQSLWKKKITREIIQKVSFITFFINIRYLKKLLTILKLQFAKHAS